MDSNKALVHFDNLRSANLHRQKEWDKKGGITDSYRANEMAGEVGEALEKAVDLIVMAVAAGRASNIVKKLERERLGIGGSRATIHELAEELADVVICADLLAAAFNIDHMGSAVPMKFNATSEKMKLLTRLHAPEDFMTHRAIQMNAVLQPVVEAIQELSFRTNPLGNGNDPLHTLVGNFSVALIQKLLAAKEKYGYGDDWRCDDWPAECRRQMLIHLEKGDPLDVAAYCAFMWHHKWSTSKVVTFETHDAIDPDKPKKAHDLPGFVKPDTDKSIFFYEQDFYVFSNFSAFNLQWAGKHFDTSEQAYQWTKFDWSGGRAVQTNIHLAKSAHDAFKIAEENIGKARPNWMKEREAVMYTILRSKVNQHPYVMKKLMDSGDREIIEDSWRDGYWGWGPDRQGDNMLGRLWMRLREELKKESDTAPINMIV